MTLRTLALVLVFATTALGELRIGDTITRRFATRDASGVAVDADSTPTAAAYVNGTLDGSVTVTVTDVGTGEYTISFTAPGTWSVGDDVEIRVAATVDALADWEIVYSGTVRKAPLTPTTSGRELDVTATGAAGIDWGNVENQTTVVALTQTAIDAVADNDVKLDSVLNALVTVDNIVDTILVDTAELQTDWTNGGRLDNILDARASQTSVDDVPTVAEFNARTLAAASYGTAANQTSILSDTNAILVDTAAMQPLIDVATSTRLATAGYTAPLDAAGTRTAIGMSSPDLDTQLDGLATDIGAIEAGTVIETRDLEPVQFEWQLNPRTSGSAMSVNRLRIAPGETIRCGFDCNLGLVLPTGAVLATQSTATPAGGDVVATKLGIDKHMAKVEVACDAGAVVGTEYLITCSVTNNLGGGPILLLGRAVVVAATEE